jgi:SAM-dependent methyltransferase
MPLNVYCITEVLPLINKKKQSNQESIVTSKKMMPKKLHDLDFSNPEEKRSYNRDLFREVSRKYDTITKVLSFGRDKAWKRLLIKKLPDMASPLCLDLACGTGDITRALSARYPDGKVTGLDLTREMLDKAEMYGIPGNVTYIEGDMNNIEKKRWILRHHKRWICTAQRATHSNNTERDRPCLQNRRDGCIS